MALATCCPACETVFRISTAQAAAKGGMVRCGQCRNVFNALDALVRVEDLEGIEEAEGEVAGASDGAAAPHASTGDHPASWTGMGLDADHDAGAPADAPLVMADTVATVAMQTEQSVRYDDIDVESMNERGEGRGRVEDPAVADPSAIRAAGPPTAVATTQAAEVLDEAASTGPPGHVDRVSAEHATDPQADGERDAAVAATTATRTPFERMDLAAPDESAARPWWLPEPDTDDEHEGDPVAAPTTEADVDVDAADLRPPAEGDASTDAAHATDPSGGSASFDDRDAAGRLVTGGRADHDGSALDRGTGPTFMQGEAASAHLGRTARWLLAALSLIAAVGLVAQAVFLWRDEIAVRWSPARPWLAAACGPLRCTVGYPMHLDAITIESATVQAVGANLDVYTLNALLRNRDGVDVRYPYLELVLTDLQDRPMLRRALRPEDYLPATREPGRASTAAAAGFAAQSELPIHVTFELSDLRFAGYRIEKYYP